MRLVSALQHYNSILLWRSNPHLLPAPLVFSYPQATSMRQSVSGRWSFTAGPPTWCTGRVSLITTASRSAALTSESHTLTTLTLWRRRKIDDLFNFVPLTLFLFGFSTHTSSLFLSLFILFILFKLFIDVLFHWMWVSVFVKRRHWRKLIIKTRCYHLCVCVCMCVWIAWKPWVYLGSWSKCDTGAWGAGRLSLFFLLFTVFHQSENLLHDVSFPASLYVVCWSSYKRVLLLLQSQCPIFYF